MFDDLRDLYQEVILDHGRRPRNFRRLENADQEARGDNPLCGDRVLVGLKLDGDTIEDVAFQGRGCAISMASASLMTETVRGKSTGEARDMGEKFRAMAMTGVCESCGEALERLQPLAGVHEFPSRVKCATLAWHTLTAALDGKGDATSDE